MSGLESRAYEAVGVDMTPQYTYNRLIYQTLWVLVVPLQLV